LFMPRICLTSFQKANAKIIFNHQPQFFCDFYILGLMRLPPVRKNMRNFIQNFA
jgi:hypothetical protein